MPYNYTTFLIAPFISFRNFTLVEVATCFKVALHAWIGSRVGLHGGLILAGTGIVLLFVSGALILKVLHTMINMYEHQQQQTALLANDDIVLE